jgi:monovalent cation/hydrogen antiporter
VVESLDNEVVLFGLIVSVTALLVLATVVRVPYPILLVVGGLALGFVPGLPAVTMAPELVLIAFLPPLLYSAAYFASLRDLRANVGPISILSVGLVLATMVGVALVAHEAIDGLPWAAAFVLGAIVSPTDPIAASAIARRLGVARRVVSIVEGEALINDGTALVAYRVAVVAVVTGSFAVWTAPLDFVVSVVGGVAVGLGVGVLIRQVRRRLDHSPTEITIALVSGYLAYLPADALGVSGVLAAVTIGIYMGWYTPELTTPQTRLQGKAVWTIVVFVLNSVLFVLVGLQLPTILDGLGAYSTAQLAGYAVLVAAAVILIRIAFVFFFAHGPRVVRVIRNPPARWQMTSLVAWMGLRGAVSLAAALALPLETDAGEAFPQRSLIIFLTFCVILATLVFQGLSLPLLIRAVRLPEDDQEEREEIVARLAAAEAAVARLDELAGEDWVHDDTAERMRGLYSFRRRRFEARFDDGDDGSVEERSQSYQRLRRELLDAERAALLQLRRERRIGDDILLRIQQDLDLEDTRLDI